MKARISRKFFCLLLAVVMVCTLLPISALADGPSGSIESAGITQNAVSVELKDVTFKTSVQVQLYSGDTLLTTATLQGVDPGSYDFLTCCIATETADEYWPLSSWTPKDNVVPDKAVLVVDGSKLAEKTFTLNADAWAALPGTYSGSIESAVITHANEVLKNAVSVELKDVTFKTSVQVQLYSGDTLLTTATLKGVDPGSYDFLTCCIATETADEYWPLSSWTPKDDVVPDKAVLVVDGHELSTKTFTLDAAEWKALPGTVLPYSGSIESAVITHANEVLKNAVSVELKDVTFKTSVQVQLYSGDTLLTTATLKGVDPGSYDFLTCCIATETADEYWPLSSWTPKDDVVPDKAVLVVDGHELSTKTFTLDAAEWKALPGTVLPYSGSIESAVITHANEVLKNAVSVELKDVTFKTSVQVQLYSGDTLLTTATLKGVDPGSYDFLTCCIATETADEYWPLSSWTPKDDVVPDKAVLVVDGHELSTKTFTLDAAEWKALPGTVLPYSGSIESAVITHANEVLKNAVSVELKDVTFKTSVQVQLYSGDTLLTTATLKGVDPGSYDFLTCCIATETADEYWPLSSWTPKDDVVPDKAVLVVDGHELSTKTFTLDAAEWKALPGTVLPYSGSIESAVITHANEVLKNAVSVELKDVTFKTSVQVQLYSGDTLLTTATLKGVDPGSYDFLTCCIATETADEYWPLSSWTPKDDVVPDKAVLVVDGHELSTKTFTLDAAEWKALPGTVLPYSGSIESAVITHANEVLKNAVSVELKDVTFKTSVQVQLYSGDTLLTTATLKGVDPGSYDFLTCCIATETADEYWPLSSWTPKDDVVPDKAVLVVDGHDLHTKTFKLDADEWANLPGTVLPYSGSIESAVITHANEVLKNAVSVELKDVTFKTSVQVQLYSGDTPLTTATLQGVDPGSYDFLTCCIATETADANWALTPWTPKDDVVPNKAVLVVDGHDLHTKTFKLDADEWANLPGTAFPSSGSINGAVITQNAVSVELENVNFESSVEVELYSGNTLLTTATLNPGILAAGQNYPFVTCCIPTEGEDAAWSLTGWTPKDDVVPNKAVLIVDGRKLDEKNLNLNANEWANLPGTAFPSSGSINGAVITQNAVSVELENVNFESSVQVKLYRDDTLLTTATLQGVAPGRYDFLTCCIATETADANWALTTWNPKDNIVPNKAVLFVDGHEQDTETLTLDADKWAALPGTAFPYSGSINGAVITQNAVSVELENVNFESSVQVKLYRDDTLLTTATLQGVAPGRYDFLTCCIATETADANWALTPWNPKDNIVPNKAVLFVDGHEQDTKTFTLDADEWAALPGTAFPYSDSISGGYTYCTIKKATPKLNTYDHFAYVQGYPDGTVKPAGNITRAETAAILFRLMDESSRSTYYSTRSGFRDVASSTWYNTYVATLNNAGVITDSANGYFRPNDAITRAELAAMLAAFTDTTHAANYFNDVTANYWAANAIAVCAKLGWITGYPDGSFRPDRNVTRAELMAMINRATGRAPKSADAFLPGMKTWSDNTADKWYYLDVQEATNSHSYAVSPTELWTALTAAPDWSRYE